MANPMGEEQGDEKRPRRQGPSGGGGRGRGRGRRPFTPKARPWSRQWTLYAPPGSADGGVPTTPVTFRVLSFNVLADYITMKDAAEKAEELWKLEWSYRRMRLVKEILAWRPHVVCLQEVDHFADFFEPELRKAGYSGTYKKRTGEETHDGCAIFVLSSCMTIVSSHPLEYFTPGHAVLDRHNVAQQVIIDWKPSEDATVAAKRFLLANTHLLFNPGRGDVKLTQLQSLLESLTNLRHGTDSAPLPVVLCGDFNLAPPSALYEFISRGTLDVSGLSKHLLSGQTLDERQKRFLFTNEQDYSRHNGHGTTLGRFTERYAKRRYFHHFPPNSIARHSLPLASAYAQAPSHDCTGEPKFTTFHDGSKGTVDYIWFTTDSTLYCHGVVEMVPAGQLFQAKCLPTEHHASDHLALIADFSL